MLTSWVADPLTQKQSRGSPSHPSMFEEEVIMSELFKS